MQPGGRVAIAGSGPIGLAALLTAPFYTASEIIMIDWTTTGWRPRDGSAAPSIG